MKLAALLAALLLLAGCASSNRSTTLKDQPTTPREPWFCETGKEDEQWQCVQSEALAANPKPSRLPPKRSEHPGATPLASNSVAAPTFRQPPQTSAANQPVASPRPQPTRPTEPPAPPPEAPTNPQPRQTEADENLPKHIALAYRPDKAVSILDLPDDYWAVQLIALSSKRALEEFAKQHNIRGMSAARIATGDKLFYVLLLGIYETRAKAEEASEGLPPPFENPWIRSIATLQKGMQAADALTGTPAP